MESIKIVFPYNYLCHWHIHKTVQFFQQIVSFILEQKQKIMSPQSTISLGTSFRIPRDRNLNTSITFLHTFCSTRSNSRFKDLKTIHCWFLSDWFANMKPVFWTPLCPHLLRPLFTDWMFDQIPHLIWPCAVLVTSLHSNSFPLPCFNTGLLSQLPHMEE